MSDEDVEIAAEWGGNAGVFAKALVEVGFIDGAEGAYSIHDWAKHNPWAADRGRRIEAATRASLARWGKSTRAAFNPGTDANEMPSASGANAERIQGALPPPTHAPPHTPDSPSAHTLAEHENPFAQPSAESEKELLSVASDKRFPKAQLTGFAAEVYSVYPRKVGKRDALKAITRAINAVANGGATEKHPDFSGDLFLAKEWLKSRTVAFAESPQGKRADTTFIPYPATWFNGGRYDDEEAEWSRIGNHSAPARTEMLTAINHKAGLHQQDDGSFKL